MEIVIHFFEHFFALCGAHSITHPTIFLVAIVMFGIYYGYKTYNSTPDTAENK